MYWILLILNGLSWYPGNKLCIRYCLSSMAHLDIQGINIVLDIAYPQWPTGYPGNKLCIWYCLSSMAYLDIHGNKLCIGYCLSSMAYLDIQVINFCIGLLKLNRVEAILNSSYWAGTKSSYWFSIWLYITEDAKIFYLKIVSEKKNQKKY